LWLYNLPAVASLPTEATGRPIHLYICSSIKRTLLLVLSERRTPTHSKFCIRGTAAAAAATTATTVTTITTTKGSK
jgi:hypothetical protein